MLCTINISWFEEYHFGASQGFSFFIMNVREAMIICTGILRLLSGIGGGGGPTDLKALIDSRSSTEMELSMKSLYP